MAGYYGHPAGTQYTCVDSHPDTLHGVHPMSRGVKLYVLYVQKNKGGIDKIKHCLSSSWCYYCYNFEFSFKNLQAFIIYLNFLSSSCILYFYNKTNALTKRS